MTSSGIAPVIMMSIPIDWTSMFTPTVSLVELFLRGTAMYLGIIIIMRLFRRQKGALNAADLLVLLLVADAAQNGLSSDYHSVSEGAVVVATIFFWDYVLDTLSFMSKRLNRIINGQPTILIENGQLMRQHLRREMLTKDDVLEQLRELGVDDVTKVKRCYLETDGHFSVVKQADNSAEQPRRVSRDGQ